MKNVLEIKKSSLFLFASFVFIIALNSKIHTQVHDDGNSVAIENYYEVKNHFNNRFESVDNKKGTGWKQFKRWEHFWKERTWPDGNFPNINNKFNKILERNHKKNDDLLRFASDWEEIGPSTFPENKLVYQARGLGRINCFAIHPENDDILWVGAAAGGAWKSTNGGDSWIKADITSFMSIGVSHIEISQTNPNLMFIATGDANGISMSSLYSIGILRSTDGGDTWQQSSLSREIRNQFIAGKVIIDPKDENIVFAATTSGIFKSTDAGETWVQKQANFYFKEMEFKPNDDTTMYAATNSRGSARIFKSTDAGETWQQKIILQRAERIELAVSEDDPEVVYALASNFTTKGLEGFYRSFDSGDSWLKVQNIPNILSRDVEGADNNGQGHYDLALEVAPFDANNVWAGGIHMWNSKDGGDYWQITNHWTGSYGLPFVHADIHYLKFNRNDLTLYCANDGGIYKTTNQGNSWKDITNGLGIMQFYKMDYSRQRNNYFIGGSQDNGTNMLNGKNWSLIYGGDGMATAIDPKDDKTFYVSTPNGTFYRTSNEGKSFSAISWMKRVGEYGAWVSPIAVDHENPSNIYIGYQNVYRSTDKGSTWQKFSDFGHQTYENIDEIVIAPSDPDIIYTSALGSLYRRVGSGIWEKIIATGRVITDIAVDNKDPYHIWITNSGYDDINKVFEFDGNDWSDISEGLPSIPANTIVHVKDSDDDLFVGTDAGVYFYNSNSGIWQPFNNGIPYLIIYDLHINYATGELLAATFGRGLWRTKIIDCDIDKPTIKLKGSKEFCEGDSLEVSIVGDYYDFEWSTGEKNENIIIKESGKYYVRVTDEEGCAENSEIIEVNVLENKQIRVLGSYNGYICEGDTIIMTAFPNVETYEWSTGETSQIIKVTEPGTYFVKGLTENGCQTISDEIVLEYSQLPEKPEIKVTAGGLKSTEADSYQWYLNSKEILGANEQYFLPEDSLSGTFTVEVFNIAGCSSISDEVYHKFTDIQEFKLITNNFVVVPNPNNGNFDLVYKNIDANKLHLTITDIKGITLIDKTVLISNISGNLPINLRNISAGVYFLGIKYNSKYKTLKIIKNNE